MRSATVLAVDLSMSMPMRDNFVPAKKMAMALTDPHPHEVPSRLPRHRRLLRDRAGGEARGAPHSDVGLHLRHQPPARAGPLPARCCRGSTAPARSSSSPTASRPHTSMTSASRTSTTRRPRDASPDDGRGHPVHPGRHHHQHLRPRPGAHPVPVRRADRPGERRTDVLHRRPTSSAATSSWTSSSTAGGSVRPADRREIKFFLQFPAKSPKMTPV